MRRDGCRGAGTGQKNGVMLTAVPDHLAHAAGFEDVVQRGNGREESLSGQVDGVEDRSTLREVSDSRVSSICQPGLGGTRDALAS